MSLLSGRIACITGSSRGIGRACALDIAKHGATGLILHYYGDKETTAEAESLTEEIASTYPHAKVLTVPGDIGNPETSQKVRRPHSVMAFKLSLTLSRSWMPGLRSLAA